MKDYMVVHTFKSEEIRQQYFAMGEDTTPDDVRAQMKNDNASFTFTNVMFFAVFDTSCHCCS